VPIRSVLDLIAVDSEAAVVDCVAAVVACVAAVVACVAAVAALVRAVVCVASALIAATIDDSDGGSGIPARAVSTSLSWSSRFADAKPTALRMPDASNPAGVGYMLPIGVSEEAGEPPNRMNTPYCVSSTNELDEYSPVDPFSLIATTPVAHVAL